MVDEVFEVLEETDAYYKVKDTETGEEKTLFKIDMKELDRKRKEEDNMIADKLSENDLHTLMISISEANQPVIDIDVYDQVANDLVNVLEDIYQKIGRPNRFHSIIKMISPKLYGKPGSFREHVKVLIASCKSIAEVMNEKGKLTERSKWIGVGQ